MLLLKAKFEDEISSLRRQNEDISQMNKHATDLELTIRILEEEKTDLEKRMQVRLI